MESEAIYRMSDANFQISSQEGDILSVDVFSPNAMRSLFNFFEYNYYVESVTFLEQLRLGIIEFSFCIQRNYKR